MWVRRLLVIDVRSDVSNVRIGQADNLARITWIGENFLISGEAGVENDFAAAPGDRSRGAPMKNAPVFERKNSLPSFCFRQWILFLPAFARALRRAGPLMPEHDGGQARHSALEKAGYFTVSANTGIEPK